VKDFTLRGPDRIVIDIMKAAAPISAPTADKPIVIALDPGPGGKDAGIVAPQGDEKTLTLDLAFAISKLLRKNPRLKVVLTRDKDMAYTLDERVAASNAAGAEILVSLHAAPGAATRVYIQELIDEPGTQRTEPMSGDFLAFETGEEHKELLWGKQQAAHARGSGALGRKLAQQLAGRDSAEPVQASLALLKAADAAAVMIETGLEMDRTHAAEAVVRGIELYVRENR
jgi:N-acetylmuramoyl-L-alanine amidase